MVMVCVYSVSAGLWGVVVTDLLEFVIAIVGAVVLAVIAFNQVGGADGLKTGHTQEAGYGFTGSAEQDGRRLVMVLAGLESVDAVVRFDTAFADPADPVDAAHRRPVAAWIAAPTSIDVTDLATEYETQQVSAVLPSP